MENEQEEQVEVLLPLQPRQEDIDQPIRVWILQVRKIRIMRQHHRRDSQRPETQTWSLKRRMKMRIQEEWLQLSPGDKKGHQINKL